MTEHVEHYIHTQSVYALHLHPSHGPIETPSLCQGFGNLRCLRLRRYTARLLLLMQAIRRILGDASAES